MSRAANARLIDLAPETASFRDDVWHGLALPQKAIPPKYFYDARGAELFEAICETPEYYPTPTETAMLARHAAEIATLIGPRARLVEYGSGGSHKVRLILDALEDPVSYVAVDISSEHLAASTARIAADYPALGVTALIADFTGAFRLPPPRRQPDTLAGLFTGSTIGNFTPTEALAFLRNAASLLKDARGGLLVGVDLKKDEDILNAAYNDAAGVTADFNLNLLDRINRELDGNFVRDRFRHRAFYNPIEGRIEMHLESLATQRVSVAGQAFAFAAGETIHTENSYKYAVEEFRALAVRAGFRPERVWTDDDCLFSIHYLRA